MTTTNTLYVLRDSVLKSIDDMDMEAPSTRHTILKTLSGKVLDIHTINPIEEIEKMQGELRHGTDYESMCQIAILEELKSRLSPKL